MTEAAHRNDAQPTRQGAEAVEALERLSAEQAALRRVATLVAQGIQPVEVFSAVSKEVDRLFPAGKSAVARFEPDGAALVVVGFDQPGAGVAVGSRWELDDSMAATVDTGAIWRAGTAIGASTADQSMPSTRAARPV